MDDRPSAIMLFAAGFGTRMAPLTQNRPKPLLKVAGKALLDHALQYCDGLRQVVNTHYLADQIIDHLRGRDVLISHETPDILETGGGLKKALPLLKSNPVFTMNSDMIWLGPNPVSILAQAPQPSGAEALLLLVPRANAVGRLGGGDFSMDAQGRLSPGADYVYTGVQIIRTERFARMETDAFPMWDLWQGMVDRGTMYGAIYPGKWCDIGRPENIALAEATVQGTQDV